MEHTRFLIVGGGMSGLAVADALGKDEDYVLLEAEPELGGYCRTVKRDGFVWDYSGHFFHFRQKSLDAELRARMGGARVLEVTRDSRILWKGGFVDFPFQKNIHQLPREDFLECLVDLYFKEERPPRDFKDMLSVKFGRGIAEKFLIPYNEKLYATDLATLDVEAMGRFFPHANRDEIIRNFRTPDNRSYNSTFSYPEGGAVQYVEALAAGVRADRIALSEPLVALDVARREATTPRRSLRYEHLVSSVPLPRLLRLAGIAHDPSVFTWNKVVVFNLGFDRKGLAGAHWVYVPDQEVCFYRVGYYDNIFGADRMSLYVEVGRPSDARVDGAALEALRARVLEDLARLGLVADHRLVAWHTVTLDPAYVHITQASLRETARARALLAQAGVHSIGRYGAWTYCSIEDNILEARALVASLRTGSAG